MDKQVAEVSGLRSTKLDSKYLAAPSWIVNT